MPTLIPLLQINPHIRLIRHWSTSVYQTCTFQKSYCCQLFYIRDGCGFLQLSYGYLSLRPGTIVIINFEEPYNIINYIGDTLHMIHLGFDYSQIKVSRPTSIISVPAEKFDRAHISCDTLPAEYPQSKNCFYLRNMQHLSTMLEYMLHVFTQRPHLGDAMLSGQLKIILCDFFATAYPTPPSVINRKREHLVWDVLDYLSLHYMENIDNTSIAEQFNYHPNYLNRQIVHLTGISLHQHLMNCRMSRAIELLLYSNASISSIAQSLGFGSCAHFSNAFNKFLGISPSSIRIKYHTSCSLCISLYRDRLEKIPFQKEKPKISVA